MGRLWVKQWQLTTVNKGPHTKYASLRHKGSPLPPLRDWGKGWSQRKTKTKNLRRVLWLLYSRPIFGTRAILSRARQILSQENQKNQTNKVRYFISQFLYFTLFLCLQISSKYIVPSWYQVDHKSIWQAQDASCRQRFWCLASSLALPLSYLRYHQMYSGC